MKRILTMVVTCASLIGFSACSDFLDEEPKSSLTSKSRKTKCGTLQKRHV